MFSAKSGKVFIFLVKLYKRVFHPNDFSHTVKFLSLWFGLVTLHDALPFYCRLRVQVAIVCLLPSMHP